jgi:hypothetical protein
MELAPWHVGAAVTLGWAHLAANSVKDARTAFERAIKIDRSFGEAHGGLAAVLAIEGEADAAQREIVVARRLNRDGVGAELAHSIVLSKTGATKAAEQWYRSIFEKRPRKDLPQYAEILGRRTGMTI